MWFVFGVQSRQNVIFVSSLSDLEVFSAAAEELSDAVPFAALVSAIPHAAMENTIAAAKDAAASFFKNLFFILLFPLFLFLSKAWINF